MACCSISAAYPSSIEIYPAGPTKFACLSRRCRISSSSFRSEGTGILIADNGLLFNLRRVPVFHRDIPCRAHEIRLLEPPLPHLVIIIQIGRNRHPDRGQWLVVQSPPRTRLPSRYTLPGPRNSPA